MIDVSAWVTHATREPTDEFLRRLDRRWRDGLAAHGDPHPCPVLVSPLHALAVTHVDRAAHKRRLPVLHVAPGHCRSDHHGHTPMSDLLPHDMYGPQDLAVRHTGDESPLAVAIEAVKQDPMLLAACVLTEDQFIDIDTYDRHAATHIKPENHGVVLPFLYVPADASEDEAAEREDLLRANGYATYTVDVTEATGVAMHRNMAALVEDLCDEVAQIKADAAARVLNYAPLWPMVIVRAPASWDPVENIARSQRVA